MLNMLTNLHFIPSGKTYKKFRTHEFLSNPSQLTCYFCPIVQFVFFSSKTLQRYCIILSLQLWLSFNCMFTLFLFGSHFFLFISWFQFWGHTFFRNFLSGALVVYAAHVVVLENLKMYFFHSLSLSLSSVTLYGMCLRFPTRIKLAPLHWKHRALITGLLGSPHPYFEKYFLFWLQKP